MEIDTFWIGSIAGAVGAVILIIIVEVLAGKSKLKEMFFNSRWIIMTMMSICIISWVFFGDIILSSYYLSSPAVMMTGLTGGLVLIFLDERGVL